MHEKPHALCLHFEQDVDELTYFSLPLVLFIRVHSFFLFQEKTAYSNFPTQMFMPLKQTKKIKVFFSLSLPQEEEG